MNHAPPLDRRRLLALLAAFGVEADALAQDAAVSNPRSFKVAFENDRVRVLDYRSRPGLGICGQGQHWHPAHLAIALTPSKIRITTAEGKVIQAQGVAGDVLWEEAVTHTVENIGGAESRAFIVELKDAQWKPSTG
jgi:beta-alanine degradation protein BauB